MDRCSRPKHKAIVASQRRRKQAIEAGWYADIVIFGAIFLVSLAAGIWMLWPFALWLLVMAIRDFGKYPEPGPGRVAMHDRLDRKLMAVFPEYRSGDELNRLRDKYGIPRPPREGK